MPDVKGVDKAIDEYLKTNGGPDVFTTGWVLVVSISSPGYEIGESDGYVTITSEGLPHHASIGLLNTSLDDKRNSLMLSTLHSFFVSNDDDDDD